jgi:hypothetical protein
MKQTTAYNTLLQRIDEFKKRYFLNQLVKGSLFFIAIVGGLFLLANTVEFVGHLNSGGRGVLLFGSLAVAVVSLVVFVVRPVLGLYGLNRPLSDTEAAKQIGSFFPEIGDKLLNTLQLQAITSQQSDLLQASLQQRSQQLLITRFANAIQINKNRRFLKYALPPIALILLVLVVNPAFFSASSNRIVNYNREFAPEAPFQFLIQNKSFRAFRNEDFTLSVKLKGAAIPQSVFVVVDGTRFKLDPVGNTFQHTFDNLQRNLDFYMEGAGFRSSDYELTLIDRPAILSFDVLLNYPAYLNKPAEQLSNVGNLLVPEGTTVKWRFSTSHADSISLKFSRENRPVTAERVGEGEFELTRRLNATTDYAVQLRNQDVPTPSSVNYGIQVITDRFPQITLNRIQDTATYNFIALSGLVADDYGFSKMNLNYRITRQGKTSAYIQREIPFNSNTTSQNFAYDWFLDSLKLGKEDRLEYFVQVWDNDGVNGPKAAKSVPFTFEIPSAKEVQEQVSKSAEKTEKEISDALAKAQAIKKELAAMENRLRTRKTADFQDKKQLQDILQKREELMQELQKMQEQMQKTNETQQRFMQQNQQMQEKMQQLEKLFKEMLDPESKQLYEQLKQMLEQKRDDKAAETLDKLNRKERNMENDLKRALKLFKQLQMDQKAEAAIQELEKQAEKQEQEAKENEKQPNAPDAKKPDEKQADQKPSADQKAQQEEQKKAEEDFKKLEEQLKELQKEAEKDQLRTPDNQEDKQQEIEKEMQDASEQLKKDQNKKASSAQSKASKSMKSMAKAMRESMQSMEMKEAAENIDDIRALLENLITLSFGQERLMKDFRGMTLQDPRLVKLSQEQLKLQDDAKVIEDSLNALAVRVVQIQPFVTRELTNMKYYMDESVRELRERRLSMASSKQQFAMTSINNLSLMLSDALKNMQEQMNAMAMPGSGKGGKKGKKPEQGQGIGDMQKDLNGKMDKLQKGGKSGRGLSEELSQLAAQQAMIRNMLKQLQEKAKGTEAGKGQEKQVQDLMEKMDQTETDLVNKRINPVTMNRQNEIVTRLLESEKALRQQEEDTKRESRTAQTPVRKPPVGLDSNMQTQQRQTEVLRSVTPNYNEFYKNQSNRYLQGITNKK